MSVRWVENRACIINGALCRNSRISEQERREKASGGERERERERVKGRGGGGWKRDESRQTGRRARFSRLRVDESGSHPLLRTSSTRHSPLAAPDQSPGFNPSPTSSSSSFSSFSTSCSSCRCALVVHRHRFHQFAINFNLKPPAKPLNPSRSQRLRSTPFATLPRAHAALSRPSPVPPSPALFERVPDWPRAFSFPSDPPSARDPTYVRRNAHR